MKNSRIAAEGLVLLGCGKMGSALLAGWLKAGLPPGSVWVISSTTELGSSTSKGLPFQATTLTSMPSLRYLRLSPICLAVSR